MLTRLSRMFISKECMHCDTDDTDDCDMAKTKNETFDPMRDAEIDE